MKDGTVEAINLAPAEGEPTVAFEQVTAVPGMGLRGERRCEAAIIAGAALEPKRQATLIEAEMLEALHREHDIELTAAESRRNICTRGVSLNDLVGRTFRVGAVRMRGVELCEPCQYLEKVTGRSGLVDGLLHRGGLRAEVLSEGEIRVGDRIQSTQESPDEPAADVSST
jgi:MOSC domain-containing protein YiiM